MANPTPHDRYVLFMDLLGFTEAVKAWDTTGRKAQLVELVRFISTAQSKYVEEMRLSGTAIDTRVRPAITTFSDCIVISFPAAPQSIAPGYDAVLEDMWLSEVLKHMAILVARIAEKALPCGLVLRGGLCRGEMVHEGGEYIIGPGFLEAYRLETTVADVPRIVVAHDICDSLPAAFPLLLTRDKDGLSYLNYMPQLVDEIAKRSDASAWRQSRLQDIDSIILKAPGHRWLFYFWRKRSASPRQKWMWYRPVFDRGTASLNYQG